jgi:hypothetical protein
MSDNPVAVVAVQAPVVPTPVPDAPAVAPPITPKPSATEMTAKLARERQKLAARAARDAQIKELETLKAQAAEVSAQKAELERWKEYQKSVKDSPAEALKLLGTDYESLTEHVLRNGAPDPKREMEAIAEAKVKAAEERRAAAEKEREDAKAREADAVIAAKKTEWIADLKSDAGLYYVNALGFGSQVSDYVVSQFYETGKLLDHREVAKQLEVKLAAAYDEHPSRKKPDAPASRAAPSPTLNGAMVAAASGARTQYPSEQERIERAKAAVRAVRERAR